MRFKQLLALIMVFVTTLGHAFCFAQAAKRYGVDERLLMAIAKQESDFKPLAIHTNDNGSVDVGLMQINSQHFKELREFNITEQALLEPCLNIHVGAWILSKYIHEYGQTWRAVGAYNAGNSPEKEVQRIKYASQVYKHLEQITNQRHSSVQEPIALYSMQVIE